MSQRAENRLGGKKGGKARDFHGKSGKGDRGKQLQHILARKKGVQQPLARRPLHPRGASVMGGNG